VYCNKRYYGRNLCSGVVTCVSDGTLYIDTTHDENKPAPNNKYLHAHSF